jgi:hypothetical protein
MKINNFPIVKSDNYSIVFIFDIRIETQREQGDSNSLTTQYKDHRRNQGYWTMLECSDRGKDSNYYKMSNYLATGCLYWYIWPVCWN